MIKVSRIYQDLPVRLSDEDFEVMTGRNLKYELGAMVDEDVQDFLDSVHKNVYYNCIYKSGGKRLKDKMIKNDILRGGMLESAIKMSLVSQMKYMLDAGGDYSSADPSSSDTNGNVLLKNNDEVRSKILAPDIENILHGVRPDLLLFGG